MRELITFIETAYAAQSMLPLIIYKRATHYRGWDRLRRLHTLTETPGEHGVALAFILSTLVRSLRRRTATPNTLCHPSILQFLNTPHSRRDLRQQALDAISLIRSNPAASTDIAIVRLALQSKAAMTGADTESAEKQAKAKEPTNRRHIPSSAPLNSAHRS